MNYLNLFESFDLNAKKYSNSIFELFDNVWYFSNIIKFKLTLYDLAEKGVYEKLFKHLKFDLSNIEHQLKELIEKVKKVGKLLDLDVNQFAIDFKLGKCKIYGRGCDKHNFFIMFSLLQFVDVLMNLNYIIY